MAYDKPVFPPQPAAWKPLAIFVAVGPPVFAAGALLGMYAFDPTPFFEQRGGCEVVESELPFLAAFSTIAGLIPSLLGAGAFHVTPARHRAAGAAAAGAAVAIATLCAVALVAAAWLGEGRTPAEFLRVFCAPILVSTALCWRLAARIARTPAPAAA